MFIPWPVSKLSTYLLTLAGVPCGVFRHLLRGAWWPCGARRGQVCRAVEQDGPIASENAETQIPHMSEGALHSPVPQVRARAEEMRCVGSKRTPEVGRDMLLAASIVKFSGALAPGGNRTVPCARARPPPRAAAAVRVV